MDTTSDPVDAVVAWIDGRLDLAFNDRIKSDLRQMSLEAQSQMFASPEVIGAAYAEILTPLIDHSSVARSSAASPESIRPTTPCRSRVPCGPASKGNGQQAIAIGATSVATVVQFCLRGLGVDPASIAVRQSIADASGQ